MLRRDGFNNKQENFSFSLSKLPKCYLDTKTITSCLVKYFVWKWVAEYHLKCKVNATSSICKCILNANMQPLFLICMYVSLAQINTSLWLIHPHSKNGLNMEKIGENYETKYVIKQNSQNQVTKSPFIKMCMLQISQSELKWILND